MVALTSGAEIGVITTAIFAHNYDYDPETGEPETKYVRFPGEPTGAELSKLKAANTGYRLIDLWTADTTMQTEF
jgi:hypothetical protein